MARVKAVGEEVEAIPIEAEPGQVMVALNAWGGQSFNFIGETIAFLDEPSWHFSNGNSWAASLCRPATPEEELQYWRGRAVEAEYNLENPDLD